MTSWSDPVVATVSAFSCPTPWVTALSIISAAAAFGSLNWKSTHLFSLIDQQQLSAHLFFQNTFANQKQQNPYKALLALLNYRFLSLPVCCHSSALTHLSAGGLQVHLQTSLHSENKAIMRSQMETGGRYFQNPVESVQASWCGLRFEQTTT